MIKKYYNFSAGPAMLPPQVMARWQEVTANSPFDNADISLMEIGHRTPAFQEVVAQLTDNLRQLLNVPNHYRILLMPGGGRMQFATVAMNLMGRSEIGADYFDTGLWSQFAMDEARRFGQVHCVASAKSNQYISIPDAKSWRLRSDAAYCHLISNETAHGLHFSVSRDTFPEDYQVPIVADMTSDLLTQPLEIEQYGLVYAASQKNLGPTGFTVVIIRDDLIGAAARNMPSLLDYISYLSDPTPATPVTFAFYLAQQVTEWLMQQGGLEALAKRNIQKAKKLYDFIDTSEAYHAPVNPAFRSSTNVVFHFNNPTYNEKEHIAAFAANAEAEGLIGLAGHRAVGGLRASLYNPMPEQGVDALIDFMVAWQDALR